MKNKLQKILNRLDGKNEKTLEAIRVFDEQISQAREKLKQEISADNLDEINTKIDKLKKTIDLSPLQEGLKVLEKNFKESVEGLLGEIESKTEELLEVREKTLSGRTSELENEIEELKNILTDYSVNHSKQSLEIGKRIEEVIGQFKKYALTVQIDELKGSVGELGKEFGKTAKNNEEELKKLEELLKKTRIELVSMIASKGGGNQNRNIAVGGNPSVLSKYTDLNIKPGSGITLSYSNNETTKYLDLTIAATAGAGGITREVNKISVSSVVGSVIGIDYVTICDEGVGITLPTAVGNENLYTVKNVATSSVLIIGDGAETIDDDATLILSTQYTSVDLISDGANWKIT